MKSFVIISFIHPWFFGFNVSIFSTIFKFKKINLKVITWEYFCLHQSLIIVSRIYTQQYAKQLFVLGICSASLAS